MENEIKRAAEMILKAKNLIALTGAGISVESGVPDFRGPGGLWEKYDPFVYAAIDNFNKMPEKVWDMLFDMIDIAINAKPNPAHYGLAELEKMDILKSIITQNIDNLHQEAGSTKVIEYHGNASKLQCQKCGKIYGLNEFDLQSRIPPRCKECDKIMKPTVVFFGEMIPRDAVLMSQFMVESADVVMVIGTSGIVYPAAGIPLLAKQNGATIIEFNIERTDFSSSITDILVMGSAGTTIPEVVNLCKNANRSSHH